MKTIIPIIMIILAVFAVGCKETTLNEDMPSAYQAEVPYASEESEDLFQIRISEGKFIPETIEINPGDTIEWVNLDNKSYMILFDERDLIFDEKIGPNSRISLVIEAEGSYDYSTKESQAMRGRIIVR